VKTIYIHAGNPKAYSTSLQYILAENHGKAVDYNGFIPQNKVEKWYSSRSISALLNMDLRISSKRSFEKKINFYRDLFSELMELKAPVRCLSSENILMRFSLSEIEVEEKLERLSRITDNICHMHLICIFRPILSSCYSIYLEYLKQGYTQDFRYFQSESQYWADSNFIDSLFPAFTEKLCNRFANIKLSYVCASVQNLDHRLKFGLRNIFPTLNISTLPHLNQNRESLDYNKLIRFNRIGNAFIDSFGILENHRILWHEQGCDDLKWNKLRARSGREALTNADTKELVVRPEFGSEFKEFIADRWFEFSDSSVNVSKCCVAGSPQDLIDF